MHFRLLWQKFGLTLALALGLIGGLMSGAPAYAGGTWAAWLYNPTTGELVQVFGDGASPAALTLPLPADVTERPGRLAVGPDSTQIAACYQETGGSRTIHVYDLDLVAFSASYAAGPITDCTLSNASFNPDGSALAIGILNHYPDPADSRPDWEIVVLDTQTNAVLHRLTSADSSTLLGDSYEGHMPLVERFWEDTIAFKPVRWGTEGVAEYASLQWDLATGSLTEAGLYGYSSLAINTPNEEFVWLAELDEYPKGELIGPGPRMNAVRYARAEGEPTTIFVDPGAVLGAAAFIDGGQRLAIHSSRGSTVTWHVLDRDGSVSSLPADVTTPQLWGTLDGYLILESGGETSQLRHGTLDGSVTGDYMQRVVWESPSSGYWQLIWVTPLTTPNLPPFPPVDGSTLPTAAAPEADALHVGGQAVTHTTEGDVLRLRSGPGTDFEITATLATGTPVTLEDGPATGSSLTWWYVRTADGLTGWAAQSVPDGSGGTLNTLQPSG